MHCYPRASTDLSFTKRHPRVVGSSISINQGQPNSYILFTSTANWLQKIQRISIEASASRLIRNLATKAIHGRNRSSASTQSPPDIRISLMILSRCTYRIIFTLDLSQAEKQRKYSIWRKGFKAGWHKMASSQTAQALVGMAPRGCTTWIKPTSRFSRGGRATKYLAKKK